MYTITKIGGTVNHPFYHEIVCSKEADIADLPTDPRKIAWGSTAMVIGAIGNGTECNMSVWILDEDYTWKRIG